MINDSHEPRLPDRNIATIPANAATKVIIRSFGVSLNTCTIDKNSMATAISPNILALIIPDGLSLPNKSCVITIIPMIIKPTLRLSSIF